MSELPPFPRLTPSATVRLTRDWSGHAWVGGTARLVAVQRELEDALARAYDAATKELSDSVPHAARAGEIGRQLQLHVSASGRHGRVTRSGDLSAIFSEMEPSEIDALTMWNEATSPHLPRVRLQFQNKTRKKAVILVVSGPDRQWIGSLVDPLSADLAKRRPWWALLRSTVFSLLLGMLVGFGIAVGFLATGVYPDADIYTVVVASLFGGVSGSAFFHPVLQWLFPGFEIVESGVMPRASKVIGGLITAFGLLLSVAGLILGALAL